MLATHVPTLQHLNCSHCLRVTDDGILKLLLGAKQLKVRFAGAVLVEGG